MMPDLGRYWLEVSASYVVSLVLLAALVAAVWWRGQRVKRQLAEMEGRRRAVEASAKAPARETQDA